MDKKENQKVNEEPEKKIITKYDKKVQKRKEAELRAKREAKIFKTVLLALVAALVITTISVVIIRYNKVHKEYIKVDEKSVSQIDFDFYYGVSKSNMLNTSLYGQMTYGSYFAQYMGYDTSKSDDKQYYGSGEENTWYDYFAGNAVTHIKENMALNKAADEAGFDYTDSDNDYNEFIDNIKSQADEEGISVKQYYKNIFGTRATEANLKDTIKSYLRAAAYAEKLENDFTPSDSDVKSYYEEHKDSYDTVNYRSFTFKADSSDAAALEAAKNKADNMASLVIDENSFISLCKDNASVDDKDKYSSDDASLNSNISKSSSGVAGDWLFESNRKTGDVTVIEDKDNSSYIVVYYVSRQYDSSNDSTISDTIKNQKYSDFITPLTENMSVDIKKEFKNLNNN